jgi:hypothetical protein
MRRPGHPNEIQRYEEGGNDEDHPRERAVQYPAEVLAEPQQRVQVLVLAPVLRGVERERTKGSTSRVRHRVVMRVILQGNAVEHAKV